MDAGFQLKIIMFLVWIFLMGMMFRGLPKSLASRRWLQVSGQVISSQIGSRQTNGKTVCVPIVSYSYNFDGKLYQSESFTFLGTSGGFGGAGLKWQVEQRLKAFTPNSSVNVFVNPKAPTEAVLLPGVHWSQYSALIFFTLFCLGVAFIVNILNFIWPGCQPNCK